MSTADVIVIGGGIAGISAAAELAASTRVVVLEAEDQLGYHTSGRSMAMFILNYGNATLRALNAVAQPVFLEPEGISDRSLLSPRGELMLAPEDELDAIEDMLRGSTGLERVSAAEAVAMVPILRPERIAAAVYEATAQDIDVDRLLQGYTRLLKARGGEIRTGERVAKLTRQGSLWQVDTNNGPLNAPVVINAAGAWADQVAGLAGAAPCGVQPLRRSVAVIPPPAGHDTGKWPLFASAAETWYAKPEAGRLLVSPADEDPVEAQDAWADDMVLAEGLHRYEQAVTVPVTRVEHSWAGLRSFAPDRTPVVGFDPEVTGFFWLAGQGGYGVQTSPALSRLTAALVLGQTPEIDAQTVQALSPARFNLNT
jgi:D-arginine dehydrogenase